LFPSLEPGRVITHPKKTPLGNQIMLGKSIGHLDHPLQGGRWCVKMFVF